jgi:Uma2 family endonuclease
MSTTEWKQHIEYPESDGLPMGETDLHIHWMIRINDILKRRYRGQRVYVASDLLVYYHEGFPSQFVVPDNFVVLDCDPGMRRVFKIWEEQRVPSVVFEVTSKSTSRNDYVTKMALYEELGVQEYFLYDPEEEYLDPPLQGQRLAGSRYEPIQAVDGRYRSQLLGVDLYRHQRDLVLVDVLTGQECLTGEESEREQKEIFREQKELLREQKDLERLARLEAETEIERLKAEIARLRDAGRQSS